MYGSFYELGMEYDPPRVALALPNQGWGFHTVGGGIDPGDHRVRPGLVAFADVWIDL